MPDAPGTRSALVGTVSRKGVEPAHGRPGRPEQGGCGAGNNAATGRCGEICCFHERAANPFPETPCTGGFPVKPIILGKIIGFGVSDFNEIGHRPKSRF